MKIRVVGSEEAISHVALSGRLDIVGTGEIEVKFLALTAAHRKPSIVDISEVTFVGSLGIGMLVGASKALSRHGKRMVLLNPTELVEKILRAGNVDEVIPIVHSPEEARRILAAD